ncbi:MAG TPA: hypothetical protein DCQ77_12195 [Betaproteobacteria bacterium]|nr:hypothetical protein [Betaproteobacteria bacterium]
MSSVRIDDASDGLQALSDLDRPALAEQWTVVFGCPAPRNSHIGLLRGALAWHAQMVAKADSGSGQVDQLVRRLRRSTTVSAPVAALAPGTRLLREWQGQTHHVMVLAQGFEYGNKTYRSLTAIARHITGTAWSGPLFFGLR